jgi:hypothetical protein
MLIPNRMLSRLQTEWLSGTLILIASIAVSWTFALDLCQMVFQCGCTHAWAGGAAHCNVHMAHGKHCPWCNAGEAGYTLLYLGIALPQAWLSFRPRSWMWPLRLVAALAAFPVFGTLEAVSLGLVTGYWR